MSPSKAARCACSFLIAAVARGQPEVHDVLAMVQGGVHLRTEPSAKKETQFPMPTIDNLDAAMDQLGPFAIQSNTVGVRLPGNNLPGESSYWGADQLKAVSVNGVATKEGMRRGSFLAGGASADQAHAMYRAGYKPDSMSPAVNLMGAAQVHPGELNMVNAVSNKDGGMDYNKLRAELSTGHIDSTSGSLGDNMPQPPDGYPRMPPRNPMGVDPSYPGLPPTDPAQWPPAQKPPGAAEVKPEWPTIQIPHSLAEQKRTEEETKRRAEEARWLEGAAKAARKAEEARKQAEEAKAIEAWLQKAGAARQALSHPVAPPVPSKALEDWLKRAGPEWLRQNAEKQKAIERWARQAGHVHDPKADNVKRLGDFMRELGRVSASQQGHPMQMQRAPVSEGPRHISQVLKQMRQAAQATMTTPGSRLPALLQVGQEQHDVDEDHEKEVGETSPSVQTDAASEHQRAIVSSNMAMQKMQMAREKLQKAVATIQKAKRRMQVLQKDNRTSSALYAKAHEKEMKYAATALSYRLKQNERESLKGRHVKLDTKAYMQRINEGNLSSYGLWTIYKGKQQFGEKTWDILSNHIFGLDKMWKNLQNATLNEMKASKFHKLAKTYDAMAASALEESAQLESTIEKAQAVVAESKAQIEEAAEVRAVQLAMKREAMRRLAKERAQTSAARHSMKKAARQARRAAKAEIEEEEEEEEPDEQDAKDDKEVEEILAAARDQSATEVAEEPEDAADTEAMDKEMEEIEHLEAPAVAATE